MTTKIESNTQNFDPPIALEDFPSHGRDLILALDRLFKVGPYYPPGHAACKRVTSDFQNVMKHFLGDKPVLDFRMEKGDLFLQDLPLDSELAGANDFKELLLTLGVDYLEIDSHASVDDLLAFVTKFLAYRNEIAGIKKFQEMSFDGLPPTIRVDQRQFTTGIAIGEGPVESAPVPGEGEEPIPETEEADQPEDVTLTDNLDHALNPNGTYVAVPPKLADHKRPVAENLDTLIDRLENAGEGNIRSRALESVELMIKNLGRNSSQQSDLFDMARPQPKESQSQPVQKKPSEKPAEKKPQKIVYELSMPELRSALSDYASQAIAEYTPPEQDNSENLSIIIQLLASKQPPEVLLRIERKLKLALKSGLLPHERDIMTSGVRHILSHAESPAQIRSLGLVAGAFRQSKQESVIRFFSDVCSSCTDKQALGFWPFVTNEVLLGPNGEETRCYLELCRRAGSVAAESMRERTPVLRKLGAVKRGLFSDDVILPPLPDLFPVFSVLLEVPHPGKLAVKLVQGLKFSSPDGVGDAVLPLISSYRHSYREFLVELFAPGQEDGPSESLLEEAGKILATDLLSLGPKRRNESWVPDTIASLADLPVPGAKSILKTIKGRRFLFLFPTWPKECRDAAKKTFKQMQINELAIEAALEAAEQAKTQEPA